MSKLISILLIIFTILLSSFVTASPVYAVGCDPLLGYPKFFPEGTDPLVVEFTIKGASNNYQGKTIELEMNRFGWPGRTSTYTSAAISGNRFSIEITDGDLKQPSTMSRSHTGKIKMDGNVLCDDISYSLGAANQCSFGSDTPSRVPPNSSAIPIKFIGRANTTYLLTVPGLSATQLGTATTDGGGQGTFDNVTIPGANGSTTKLLIRSNAAGTQSCDHDVIIDINASAPTPPSENPVVPGTTNPGPSTKQCDPNTDANCSSSAGDKKSCSQDPAHPEISTAIGCVPTNPAELIAAAITFLLGISGGIAFLMMLLGAFQMLASAGNPDTLRAGRERFSSAIIGLLFVIFAILLLQTIGANILNIPGFS